MLLEWLQLEDIGAIPVEEDVDEQDDDDERIDPNLL